MLGESLVNVIAPALRLVLIPVPPKKLSVSVVTVADVVPLSAPNVSNKFWSGAPSAPVIVTVSVSPTNAVEMFVPPTILNVSFAADAVVVPVSPVNVSNRFCVVPPPPVAVSSLAGSHLVDVPFHFNT